MRSSPRRASTSSCWTSTTSHRGHRDDGGPSRARRRCRRAACARRGRRLRFVADWGEAHERFFEAYPLSMTTLRSSASASRWFGRLTSEERAALSRRDAFGADRLARRRSPDPVCRCWLVGVVLLWISSAWTRREKVIGTLVIPGGLALPMFLLAVTVWAPSSDGCDPPRTTPTERSSSSAAAARFGCRIRGF